MDQLDRILLFKPILRRRKDILNNERIFNTFLAIRRLNSLKTNSNYISIYYLLKREKRQVRSSQVSFFLNSLSSAGYIRLSSARCPNAYITELGKNVLDQFNQDIINAQYSRKKSELPVKRTGVKRPGLI